MALVNEIYNLVGQNRLDEALKMLDTATRNHPKLLGEVTLISGRFHSYKSKVGIGVIGNDEIQEECSIRASILSLVERITPNIELLEKMPVDKNNNRICLSLQFFRLKVSLSIESLLFMLFLFTIVSYYCHVNNKRTTYANTETLYVPPNIQNHENKIFQYKGKNIKKTSAICSSSARNLVMSSLPVVEYNNIVLNQCEKSTVMQKWTALSYNDFRCDNTPFNQLHRGGCMIPVINNFGSISKNISWNEKKAFEIWEALDTTNIYSETKDEDDNTYVRYVKKKAKTIEVAWSNRMVSNFTPSIEPLPILKVNYLCSENQERNNLQEEIKNYR